MVQAPTSRALGPISFERVAEDLFSFMFNFPSFSGNHFNQFHSLQLLHLESRECYTNSRQSSQSNLWLHSSENYSHLQSSPLVPWPHPVMSAYFWFLMSKASCCFTTWSPQAENVLLPFPGGLLTCIPVQYSDHRVTFVCFLLLGSLILLQTCSFPELVLW